MLPKSYGMICQIHMGFMLLRSYGIFLRSYTVWDLAKLLHDLSKILLDLSKILWNLSEILYCMPGSFQVLTGSFQDLMESCQDLIGNGTLPRSFRCCQNLFLQNLAKIVPRSITYAYCRKGKILADPCQDLARILQPYPLFPLTSIVVRTG